MLLGLSAGLLAVYCASRDAFLLLLRLSPTIARTARRSASGNVGQPSVCRPLAEPRFLSRLPNRQPACQGENQGVIAF